MGKAPHKRPSEYGVRHARAHPASSWSRTLEQLLDSRMRVLLTRCHWGRAGAGPVQDRSLNRLKNILRTETVKAREHWIHWGLHGIHHLGAAHGAARGGQRRGGGELAAVVGVGFEHEGGLVNYAIAVERGRLRARGTRSRVNGRGRHHLVKLSLSGVGLGGAARCKVSGRLGH